MFRPLIGVPSYSYDNVLDKTYPSGFLMGEAYIRRLEVANATPVIVPLLREPGLRDAYERLDGLLLAGGGDVDPAHYGEARYPKLDLVDPERDRVELALARWALDDGLPVFAICRGIQVLNVAAGGTLYQDIPSQVPNVTQHRYPDEPADYRAHEVTIEPDSGLAELMGSEMVAVNTSHHQAIEEPASGFRVTATTLDGVIEGIEREEGPFVVGVQWHPERLADEDPRQQALFDGFVEEALRFSQ